MTETGTPERSSLHVVSWNVSGFEPTHGLLRSHYGGLSCYLKRLGVDIFCIQETKIRATALRTEAAAREVGAVLEDYRSFWAFNRQQGSQGAFNGVATWVRSDLAAAATATQDVLGEEELDSEGRCLLVDLGAVAVLNVYAHHVGVTAEKPRGSKPGRSTLAMADLSLKKVRFLQLVKQKAQSLRDAGKAVLLCGDLNLTWRQEDVQLHRCFVPVSDRHVAGCDDWLLPDEALQDKTDKSSAWLRVADVAKALKVEMDLPAKTTRDLLSCYLLRQEIPAETELPRAVPKGFALQKVAGEDVSRKDVEGVLERLIEDSPVTVEFGLPAEELRKHAQPPHRINETAAVELLVDLVGPSGSFVDTFAACHEKAQERFSCWWQQANCRFTNCGSRIDYVLCDKDTAKLLVPSASEELTGASPEFPGQTREAARNAATNFGQWHGAHQTQRGLVDGKGGLGLQQDDMRLNNSQFRAPHTGMLYTPPSYSDHIPVTACFELCILCGSSCPSSISEKAAKACTPWVAQAMLFSFFSSASKRPRLA